MVRCREWFDGKMHWRNCRSKSKYNFNEICKVLTGRAVSWFVWATEFYYRVDASLVVVSGFVDCGITSCDNMFGTQRWVDGRIERILICVIVLDIIWFMDDAVESVGWWVGFDN